MAPTETNKDLAVKEKLGSPNYDNADIGVALAVKDVDVVERTTNDANDEDYTSSGSEVTRSHAPRPKDSLRQLQRPAFEVEDYARLPRRGGPPMEIKIKGVQWGRSGWEYQAEDSDRKPVNTIPGGVGYEWIKQRRLIRA